MRSIVQPSSRADGGLRGAVRSAEEAPELLTAGAGYLCHIGDCLNLEIERIEDLAIRRRLERYRSDCFFFYKSSDHRPHGAN